MQYLGYLYNRIRTNLPFRMSIGKLGIVLVRVGRALQTRYANWNSEFRLKHTVLGVVPAVIFHVSEQVTGLPVLTYSGPSAQLHLQTPLVRALFGIKGVAEVRLEPYRVRIEHGEVFDPYDLIPEIDAVILKHLTA